MPNTRSAAKQVRVQERRRLRNQAVRSSTRTYVRKAEAEMAAGSATPSSDTIRAAISALDRAASKGVIHANNAARRKSRLMKKVNRTASTSA